MHILHDGMRCALKPFVRGLVRSRERRGLLDDVCMYAYAAAQVPGPLSRSWMHPELTYPPPVDQMAYMDCGLPLSAECPVEDPGRGRVADSITDTVVVGNTTSGQARSVRCVSGSRVDAVMKAGAARGMYVCVQMLLTPFAAVTKRHGPPTTPSVAEYQRCDISLLSSSSNIVSSTRWQLSPPF